MPGAFLDHCATTPLDPRVAEAMAAARERLTGNPSSIHAPGRRARAVINEARVRVAQLLSVAPGDIVFTASASESNNLALKGAVLHAYPAPFRLIVSAIEHDSVRLAARYLAGRFPHVTLREVHPDTEGRIQPADVDRACAEAGASMICVMTVNNETGVIQPVEEIGAVARSRGALFLSDAVQGLGRIALDPRRWGCDFLSASGHKIYGPRGVGLLYVRNGVKIDPLFHGGHQESGRRGGTEFGEGIAGFSRAAELACAEAASNDRKLAALERAFVDGLNTAGLDFGINGLRANRVAGVLNIAVRGIASHDLVVGMDLAGFAVSAGAACSSGVIEPSHVLRAMAIEPWRIEGGIRVSFGHGNTESEAREAAAALAALAGRLQTGQTAIPAPS